jgi:hypothetical protein
LVRKFKTFKITIHDKTPTDTFCEENTLFAGNIRRARMHINKAINNYMTNVYGDDRTRITTRKFLSGDNIIEVTETLPILDLIDNTQEG